MTPLKYTFLDPSLKEIRLIKILDPDPEVHSLNCRLSTVSLLDNPSFTALSYVWGDASITKDIMVDGSTAFIPINLAQALSLAKDHWQRQYPNRDPTEFRLWADALCINQKDVEEKNHQVQLMQSIYPAAELVLAWLGSDDDEMCLALRSFETLAREIQELDEDDYSLQWMEKYDFLCVEDTIQDGDHLGNRTWTALWLFFELDYWKRVWIFQEMVLGNNVLFCYASTSLWFEELSIVCTWIKKIALAEPSQLHRLQRPPSMSQAAWRAVTEPFLDWYLINNIRLAKIEREIPARRWNFLILCRYLSATDPKDHIYAILGILERKVDPKIIPAYEKSVGEIYSEAFGYWIEEEQDLQFLHLAGTDQCGDDPDLPSWVPNFPKASRSQGSRLLNDGHADWKVFPDHTEATIVSGLTLQASGLELDEITHVASAPKVDSWGNGHMLQYCIEFKSRTPVYITGIPPLQALFHVLMTRHNSPEADDSEAESIQEADMEEDHQYYYLLALGFLRYVLLSVPSEVLDVKNTERFSLLGLQIGDKFPESFEKAFYPGCRFRECGLPNLATEFHHLEGLLADASRRVMQRVISYKDSFCYIETAGGYLGLAPEGSRVGDKICILKGCPTPVILRKGPTHYIHVGTCFVLGLMEGQAAEWLQVGRAKAQGFEVR
jgi:Heterokaryon incompatibility protein (HET)